MARTGRRPGAPDTREAILTAARAAFAERGFDNASIRIIATAAGVDPALVHHYFGNKDQLFLAAMAVPVDPAAVLGATIAGDPATLGERVVRTLLAVWDSPVGETVFAIVRSAVNNERIAAMMREFLLTRALAHLAAAVDMPPEETPLRLNLVATQIAGLVMVRYLVRFEPLASAPAETIVALTGPTVQRYLTGVLPDFG